MYSSYSSFFGAPTTRAQGGGSGSGSGGRPGGGSGGRPGGGSGGIQGGGVKKPSITKKPRIISNLRDVNSGRKELNAQTALLYPYTLDGTTTLNEDMSPILNRYSNTYTNSYFKDIPLIQDPSSGNSANGLVWYFFDSFPDGSPWHPTVSINPTINGQNVNITNNPRSEPTFNIVGNLASSIDNPYQYVCVIRNKELRAARDQTNLDAYDVIRANVVGVVTHIGREMVRYVQASRDHVRCYYVLRMNSNGTFTQLYGLFKPYNTTPQGSPQGSLRQSPPQGSLRLSPPRQSSQDAFDEVMGYQISPPRLSPPRLSPPRQLFRTSSDEQYDRDIDDILGGSSFGRKRIKKSKISLKSLKKDLKKLKLG